MHQSSTVAFFTSGADHRQQQCTNSRWQLPSASLEVLRPSSAGLKSVQTWSASATHRHHMRAFFCVQCQKCKWLLNCAYSEHGKSSDINAKSSTPVNWEVEWTGYGSSKWMNKRATQQGVYETDPPERTGIHLCWNQEDKTRNKISGCPHRTNGWATSTVHSLYIYTIDYRIKAEKDK